jgi:hypothetical protein
MPFGSGDAVVMESAGHPTFTVAEQLLFPPKLLTVIV